MDKRIGGLVFFALTFAALAFFVRLSAGGVRFEDCLTGTAELDTIVEARQPSQKPLLISLSFNEYALPLDTQDGSFLYSLCEGEAQARNPVIRCGTRAHGVRIAIERASLDETLLRQGRTLRLIAYTDTAYTEYSLGFTTLPVMQIACRQEILGDDVPAEITLFDNGAGVTRRVLRSLAMIHVRGITSALFEKKGYRLSLVHGAAGSTARENDLPLLGLREDGDWLLYACYDDQEKVRNVFSSRLWYDSCAANNPYGVTNGMTYRFVELFMGERYWGLYALGFPIDAKQEALKDDELLCKLNRWWNPFDEAFDGYGETDGYFTLTKGRALLNTPDEALNPLRAYGSLLGGGADAGFTPDMNSATDLFLFYNLIQGSDNYLAPCLKNTVFTFKGGPGGYEMLYAPWDLNYSWGNRFTDNARAYIDVYGASPQENVEMQANPVYVGLEAGDAQMRRRLAGRYAALRADAWSEETLGGMIDEYEAQIFFSGAYAREMRRWPNGLYAADPAGGLGAFRAYVMRRLSYMDQYVEALTRED